MKKVLLAFAVASIFAACEDSKTDSTTTDSTNVKVDTATIPTVTDTTTTTVDTGANRMSTDTTRK